MRWKPISSFGGWPKWEHRCREGITILVTRQQLGLFRKLQDDEYGYLPTSDPEGWELDEPGGCFRCEEFPPQLQDLVAHIRARQLE